MPKWVAGLDRAMLIALVMTLTATLLAASTPRNTTVTLDAPIATSGAPASEPTGSVQSVAAAAPVTSASGEGADALAGIIARKYRISQTATRDMIAAAYREGQRNGLDPLLIVAVMAVESRFNPIAESDMGAVGLMQVIPRYHADKFDAANGGSVLDPETNIQVGARVLKEYIRRSGSQAGG